MCTYTLTVCIFTVFVFGPWRVFNRDWRCSITASLQWLDAVCCPFCLCIMCHIIPLEGGNSWLLHHSPALNSCTGTAAMLLPEGASSLYKYILVVYEHFFEINSQTSHHLCPITAWSGMSHVATWWLLGMAVEWRMFPLCLSQCPGWLNPCKNVLLVFLIFLINTWPLLYRDDIGQPGRKNIPVEIQNGVKHNRSLDVLASSHCG